MNRLVFRAFVVAHVTVSLTAVALAAVTEPMLPELLQLYVHGERQRTTVTHAEVAAMVLCLALLPALVASWVGLYTFWRPAPYLYAALNALGLVATFLMGPTLGTGWATAFYDLGSISAGALIAVALCDPVAREFRKPRRPAAD